LIINNIVNRIANILIADKIVKEDPILILSITGKDMAKAIDENKKLRKLFKDAIVAEFCCSLIVRYEEIEGR